MPVGEESYHHCQLLHMLSMGQVVGCQDCQDADAVDSVVVVKVTLEY